MVQHHDALHLRFRHEAQDRQAELAAVRLTQSKCTGTTCRTEPPERWASLIEARCTAGQAMLDIERGPLLHAAYFHLGAGLPGRLFLAVHHLAVDGVSWRILLEDLEAAYGCLGRDLPVTLPPKTTSFQQWADRLVAQARSATISGSLATWQALTRQLERIDLAVAVRPITRSSRMTPSRLRSS